MKFFVLASALALGVASVGWADPTSWTALREHLGRWEGPRQISVRADADDPLASPAVGEVTELLLGEGFSVRLDAPGAATAVGLVLELRLHSGSPVGYLLRGADRTVLMVLRPRASLGEGAGQAPEAPVPPSAPRAESSPSVVVEVSGHPRGLALAGPRGSDDLRLALLRDDALEVVGVRSGVLEPVARFAVGIPGARALAVSSGDLDGDGELELVAVWAEDLRGIYDGTDSRLHAWVLAASNLSPRSRDLGAYLRVVGDRAYAQRRGLLSPFDGPVVALLRVDGVFALGQEPVPWAGRDLFSGTPRDRDLALVREPNGGVFLADRSTGTPVAGSALLGGVGPYRGPAVAVRLEEPQYRSGFAKEDQVRERWHPLAARLLTDASGGACTIERARSVGLPLLGRPSGRDSVVCLRGDGAAGLRPERVSPEVDAFVFDFALVGSAAVPQVVLLVTENPDGSGPGRLVVSLRR